MPFCGTGGAKRGSRTTARADASDIALQVAEVESIDFQLKWVEEVCLQHQEELEQMNQSGA